MHTRQFSRHRLVSVAEGVSLMHMTNTGFSATWALRAHQAFVQRKMCPCRYQLGGESFCSYRSRALQRVAYHVAGGMFVCLLLFSFGKPSTHE